jgi:hypothetical protein
VWSGVDRDAGAVGRHRDARLAETADDADRLADGDRAVLGSSDPLGSMAIPSPSLSETSVFDMNSLLEAFGWKKTPLPL